MKEEWDEEPILSNKAFMCMNFPERCLVAPFDVLPKYVLDLQGPVEI
jgi:hypothetical protein